MCLLRQIISENIWDELNTNETDDDDYRYILTCGTDGDVRIWEGIQDDDAVSHRVGDRAFAIAFKVSMLHCWFKLIHSSMRVIQFDFESFHRRGGGGFDDIRTISSNV